MEQPQPTVKHVVPDRDDPERGKKLRAIRESMSLSRKEFADSVGMGASTLALYENGNNNGFPFSKRLTAQFKLFVEQGIKTTKKHRNASNGPKAGGYQGPITRENVADLIPIQNRTEIDLVRELQRRGFKVTLTM